MNSSNSKNIEQSGVSKRTKRMVTVDGVRYSLNTGDRLGVAPARRTAVTNSKKAFIRPLHREKRATKRLGELPLPKAVEMTAHQQVIMHPDPKLRAAAILHPHGVSHPSLPLPNKPDSIQRTTLWRHVFAPSLADGRSRKGVLASIGIVALSPVTWIYIFMPAVIFVIAEAQKQPIQNIYNNSVGFLRSASADSIFWLIIAAFALLGLMWFIRHLCLIVAYGLAAKKIDSRSASAHHLWWQAVGKIWKFAVIALFDFLLAGAAAVAIVLILSFTYSGHVESVRVSYGVAFNFGILVALMWVWLISTHRPITRVMLALTNRPASFIIVRSFGLVFRNLGRSMAIGLFWLIVAAITAGLVAAICWSTVVYGLLQITTSTGRMLLFAFAAGLVMFVLSLFTIWSVSYWPRAYNYLAKLAYPKQISQFMVDTHHEKSMRRIIIDLVILIVIFGGLLGIAAISLRPYFVSNYYKTLESIPRNAQDILKNR